jgi:hypothetical protein
VDLADGGAHGVLEHVDGEPGVGRAQLVAAVVGHRAVEPDERVHVHQAALVVLADVRVRRRDAPLGLGLGEAGVAGDVAAQVDRRAPPQLADRVVPDHGAVVVVAVQAQRLAEARVVLVVQLAARQRHAVRADRRVAPGAAVARLAVRAVPLRVHRAEARCRQRDEHHRMLRDRFGDALAAAQAGDQQLVGVPAIGLGARRTDRGAPVAARLPEHAVGLGVGREHAPAPGRVLDVDVALEAHRPRAVARRAQLRLKAREVRPAGAARELAQQLRARLGQRRCGHGHAAAFWRHL